VHIARMEQMRHANKSLAGKPEGKRPLVRPRRRWEDNIRMHLREVGLEVWTRFIRLATSGGLL
jgi:hypothetical protein